MDRERAWRGKQGASLASGHVESASAVAHPLPSDSANAFITDPPYYDAVPYSHLADFFYVWLRRSLGTIHKELFSDEATPKSDEIVVDRPHELSTSTKGIAFYESELAKAFGEGQRVVRAGWHRHDCFCQQDHGQLGSHFESGR